MIDIFTVLDAAGAAAIAAAGLLGLRTWRLVHTEGRLPSYWLAAGSGLIFLALDELLNLHEAAGRSLWLAGFPHPPFVNHHDDIFIVAYALLGMAITLVCWRQLVRFPVVLLPFAAALAITAFSVAVDAKAPTTGIARYVEEVSEVAGAVLFATAFRLRYLIASDARARPAHSQVAITQPNAQL